MPQQEPPSHLARSQGLDVLRATAVLLVIAYHFIQMSPVHWAAVSAAAQYGRFGVNLFFVLSGWLIGGIFWKELAASGAVRLGRFWFRRWMRTLPPYFGMLLVSWLAVAIVERQPFDWGYLVFIQNYYREIPYFLVSWSLCVEEHFYLAAPVLAMLVMRWAPAVLRIPITVVLFLTPMACRAWLARDGLDSQFGFEQTATHLNLEGLTAGVALAFMARFHATSMAALTRAAAWAAPVAVGLFVAARFFGPAAVYVVDPLLAAVIFASALLLLRDMRIPTPWLSRAVYGIAISSYSLYLIHPVALHLANLAMDRVPAHALSVYVIAASALIAVGGAAYYLLVERTAIRARDSLQAWRARRKPSAD